jgi:hypothetical protein
MSIGLMYRCKLNLSTLGIDLTAGLDFSQWFAYNNTEDLDHGCLPQGNALEPTPRNIEYVAQK